MVRRLHHTTPHHTTPHHTIPYHTITRWLTWFHRASIDHSNFSNVPLLFYQTKSSKPTQGKNNKWITCVVMEGKFAGDIRLTTLFQRFFGGFWESFNKLTSHKCQNSASVRITGIRARCTCCLTSAKVVERSQKRGTLVDWPDDNNSQISRYSTRNNARLFTSEEVKSIMTTRIKFCLRAYSCAASEMLSGNTSTNICSFGVSEM